MGVAHDVNKKLSKGAEVAPVRSLKYTSSVTISSKELHICPTDGHAIILIKSTQRLLLANAKLQPASGSALYRSHISTLVPLDSWLRRDYYNVYGWHTALTTSYDD